MKCKVYVLLAVNLFIAFFYCIQGTFILHPCNINYQGRQIYFVMALLGPPHSVSFNESYVLLHYQGKKSKNFDIVVQNANVLTIFIRE